MLRFSQPAGVHLPTRDKGVHPEPVERAFRKSTWNDYTRRTSQEQAHGAVVERETKLERLRGDIQSLEQIQSTRPLKPPGKR